MKKTFWQSGWNGLSKIELAIFQGHEFKSEIV